MGKRGRRSKRTKGRGEPTLPEPTRLVKLLSAYPAAKLDLHGYSAAHAESRVRSFLATEARKSEGQVVHVITGKGAGSEGVAVLLGLVRDLLDEEVGRTVQEYAGLMGGGGWVVRIAGGSR